MTVIVYDRKLKTMASDSLCSQEGFYLTKTKKLFRLKNGAIIGTAGDDDCRSVLGLLGKAENFSDLPAREKLAETKTRFQGLLVIPDNTVFQVDIYEDIYSHDHDPWRGSISAISERFACVGHGMDFAKAVLLSGGTLQEAVKIACKMSLFCGLPVQTLKLESILKRPKLDGPEPVIIEPAEEED